MQENVQASEVLRVQDLGMVRVTATDRIVLGFASYAEARIAKWVQFPRGVLLFLMVPGDPESGCFYVFDRARGIFYMLDIPEDGRWGGYRLDECDGLTQAFALKQMAEKPRRLRAMA